MYAPGAVLAQVPSLDQLAYMDYCPAINTIS